jgi:hypothetical protein
VETGSKQADIASQKLHQILVHYHKPILICMTLRSKLGSNVAHNGPALSAILRLIPQQMLGANGPYLIFSLNVLFELWLIVHNGKRQKAGFFSLGQQGPELVKPLMNLESEATPASLCSHNSIMLLNLQFES